MSTAKACLSLLLLFLTAFSGGFCAYSQALQLRVAGNDRTGYRVDIYNKDRLLVTNTEEFTLRLFNTDHSTAVDLPGWTGAAWSGDARRMVLTRELYVAGLDANLSVSVTYEIINPQVVKKRIRLLQPSMPDMYYILEEKKRPAVRPQKYITFEQDSFPGGLVHEMYPSAGWVTPDGTVVGVLTDAGYKNDYTRTTRRRYSGRGGGFVGMRKLPDPALYWVDAGAGVAGMRDASAGAAGGEDVGYVRQTFGEMYNLDAGTRKDISVVDWLKKGAAVWQPEGRVEVSMDDSVINLSCHPSGRSGISFISPLKDQRVYTISFLARGNTPVAMKLHRIKDGKQGPELEEGIKYIDQFPVSDTGWSRFEGSILVPYIGREPVSLFIGTQSGRESHLQIRDMRITEQEPAAEAYNKLPLGEAVEKTTYVFAEPYAGQQQYMISSQSRLAEGMGFRGSLIEKMLYANFNMLTWVTTVNDRTPFNVPNMNYSPDMYNRDSYFSVVSTYNKELNLAIFDQWGRTQTPKGGIGTIITPYMGSVEAKDNEATIEWLIWALLNRRRFGVQGPKDKIDRAVSYVLREFDSAHDGKCRSHFPMSQVDIIDYNPKTDRLAVNQGMLAIGLRVIKELGYDIQESYLEKVEAEYRNFYDPVRKHLLFDRNYPDILSLTDLEPEFFSLWLFNRPILTDEMVTNHLNQVPVLNKVARSPHPEYGTTAPICVRITKKKPGFAYLSKEYQPFEKFGEENYADGKNDGYYYNGGSWMRAEYCAYVTGLKHGWSKARPLMENRVWAEIYLNPKWPFSKEFIPTRWTSTDSWWESTKGLCWNVFILMADELAGLRTPDMDPDYAGPGGNGTK